MPARPGTNRPRSSRSWPSINSTDGCARAATMRRSSGRMTSSMESPSKRTSVVSRSTNSRRASREGGREPSSTVRERVVVPLAVLDRAFVGVRCASYVSDEIAQRLDLREQRSLSLRPLLRFESARCFARGRLVSSASERAVDAGDAVEAPAVDARRAEAAAVARGTALREIVRVLRGGGQVVPRVEQELQRYATFVCESLLRHEKLFCLAHVHQS